MIKIEVIYFSSSKLLDTNWSSDGKFSSSGRMMLDR